MLGVTVGSADGTDEYTKLTKEIVVSKGKKELLILQRGVRGQGLAVFTGRGICGGGEL